MKKKIFNMFCSIFEKELNDLKKEHALVIESDIRKKNIAKSSDIVLEEMLRMVGEKVISISNEWDNPIVGVVKRVELISQGSSPLFIVHDYIKNEEFVIMGKTLKYTNQRLDAILKLNPFELCSLMYSYNDGNDFDKEKMNVRDSKEVIMQKLIKNGFFDLLEKNNEIKINKM